jgi:hypothetical protein
LQRDDAFAVLPPLVAGAAAGVLAGTIQVVIGKTEEIAILPQHEDSNFAPRLVDRLASMIGQDASKTTEWVLGTAVHFGYAATWGALYALARERYPTNPWVGGAALGGLIYLITFPSWGGAVRTGTERRPESRSWAMEVVAASVAVGFGLSTSLIYESMRR